MALDPTRLSGVFRPIGFPPGGAAEDVYTMYSGSSTGSHQER